MSRMEGGFVDSLVASVRENPLAAALIGGGALWLLTGNEGLKKIVDSATSAASPLVGAGARNMQAAASGLQRTEAPPTAPDMGNGLRETAHQAADAVSGAADKIRSSFDGASDFAREKVGNLGNSLPGKESLNKAQSTLSDVFDRQPLAIGMIGLAIGAAVAGAFGTSDLENEWLGEVSDEVKADLSTRAGAVSQSVRESSDTLMSELSDTGAEVVDRLKQTGRDAANAAEAAAKSDQAT